MVERSTFSLDNTQTGKTSLFFLALLPPAEIQAVATAIKQEFAEIYNSSAALRSPPHITLHPPFVWPGEKLTFLRQQLQNFARTQPPVPMILNGFSAFKPRVIHINVVKTPQLLAVYQNLAAFLEAHCQLRDEVGQKRPFSPHLTVAFRDLTKANFQKAWANYAEKPLYFEFTASHLTLLEHNSKKWEICQEFLWKN